VRGALLAAGLFCASAASATDFTRAAVGTSGSQFLLEDIGARGIAMGGAYSAITNDAYSMYWNPAGLSHIPRFSAGVMYNRYVADISYQTIQAAGRINDVGVLAGGVRYQDIGSIAQTDLSGNQVGNFHPRDYVAEMGWGQSVLDLSDSEVDVTMGVAGRWIHSDYVLHADGYGGDIGIQSRFYTSRYTYDLSFVAQNMGMGQKFDQVRDTLPFRARLGAAVSPTRVFTLSIEAIMQASNVASGAVGAEYVLEINKDVKGALRGGFNTLTLDSLGVASALSAGLGLTMGNITFDYSFVPMGPLGTDTHRFSLSYNLPAKASRRYRER
jgi:hypothetical protein